MTLGSNPLLSLELNGRANEPRRRGGRSQTPAGVRRFGIAPEESFHKTLALEKRRSERSHQPFLLMLLEGEKLFLTERRERVLQQVLASLSDTIRQTDAAGWFKEDAVIGLIFTEVGPMNDPTAAEAILTRVMQALRSKLASEDADSIDLTLQAYPEEWNSELPALRGQYDSYPDLAHGLGAQGIALALKRLMDIGGSLLCILLLSPLLALVAVLIKLTSKGPILFRQTRVGQREKPFAFLKFRTMQAANDPRIHQEYVRHFIAGKSAQRRADQQVFKITDDPRITGLGKFLRRSSIDELPQLFNVFMGDMSLVGPRPPIPYEYDLYQPWHRGRVLEAKPGMTGLWQVNGRSRTSFDEMVRLDLRYARSWSLWLDIKILLQTPRAVISGEGAY